MGTNSTAKRVIVSWSYRNAQIYCDLMGWDLREVSVAEDYQELYALDGAEVTVLGPRSLYEPGVYEGVIWALDVLGDRVKVYDDDTDRLMGANQ